MTHNLAHNWAFLDALCYRLQTWFPDGQLKSVELGCYDGEALQLGHYCGLGEKEQLFHWEWAPLNAFEHHNGVNWAFQMFKIDIFKLKSVEKEESWNRTRVTPKSTGIFYKRPKYIDIAYIVIQQCILPVPLNISDFSPNLSLKQEILDFRNYFRSYKISCRKRLSYLIFS